jgi:hypothetical protein
MNRKDVENMRRNRAAYVRAESRKRLGAALLAAAIGAAVLAAGAGSRPAAAAGWQTIEQSIQIEGATHRVPSILLDGTTYVGLRALNEKLGIDTRWDEAARTITVLGNGRTLVLNTKTGDTRLNDQNIHGLPTLNQDGWTYLPLRFLMERMGYSVSYDPATRLIGIGKIPENELTIANARIEEHRDEPPMTLEVNYPVLSGLADADAQDKINAFLKSEAESHARSGKAVLERAVANMGAGQGGDVRPVNFQGSYYVTYNENNLLSLYVDYYQYTGGAHGITVRVPYTFNLADGRQLTLREAADSHPDYLKIINAEISRQIQNRGIPMLTPFVSIEPDRPFYLSHEGVVLFFQQYEYTPYAAGMPEFRIPYSAFR